MNSVDGYWEFDHTIPPAAIADFSEKWANRKLGETPFVRKGMRFVPFSAAAVPDALCRYCWSVNFHTSTSCEKCGAPLIGQG